MIAVSAAAAFLATFNETFLNVAFTPIMQDFGIDVNTVQWLTTGYLLVAAVFVPVSVVLYHRFPTRPLVVAVLAIMVVGSVVGALAPTFGVLLIGRLLQAVGTGLITPIGMNIALAVAPREKLGLTMGIMAAMTTLGPSLAIVLSGAMLTTQPWTTLMWAFGALTLVLLVASAIILRTVADLGRPVFDIASFLLVAVGLGGVLYAVTAAFSGSLVYTLVSGVVGLVALWLFIRRQKHIEHPLLNLRPFSNSAFTVGVLMTMLGLLFVFAMNVIIPLFLQGAHGTAPMVASLTLAPGILLTVVMGPIAGRLFDRHGGRWSIPLGFLAMAVFVTCVGVAAGQTSIVLFGLLYVPAVLATAFVIGPSQTFALSSLNPETSPHGVAVVSTSFQIAGCVGTSLATGIYGALTAANLGSSASDFDAQLVGFRGAVALVVVTSLIGIVLAIAATRRGRVEQPAEASLSAATTVASVLEPDVYTLTSDQTVLEALRTFAERGISGAPVVHADGSLAGFLSDGDVMRYLSANHPSSASIYTYLVDAGEDVDRAMTDLADVNVLRLATRDVITIDVNASIADAVAILSDTRLKKVPVLDGDNPRPVGIVSRSAINRLVIAGYLREREDITTATKVPAAV
ncbi:MFS transporter, DHA2 family, lincomycin resistance protein [Raineyella antarctica]|uniref:MFS transporter, DHA2 family, lincomycin resistance protein n=1 Tax=Raineyella antarctica TaxID=1577474 RepID=A0A1G6GDB5_9ACTN|nr:MFS transporter [Raineyella antarctica]SDB79987.1 MFS transporter, DHA2 family, lincomycin resistance protein [Raineyella antarctica]